VTNKKKLGYVHHQFRKKEKYQMLYVQSLRNQHRHGQSVKSSKNL